MGGIGAGPNGQTLVQSSMPDSSEIEAENATSGQERWSAREGGAVRREAAE